MKMNEILNLFSLQGVISGILSGLVVYYFVSNSGDVLFELSPVSFILFLSFPIVYFLMINDMVEVLPKNRWLFAKLIILCIFLISISIFFIILFYIMLDYLDSMLGLKFTDDASFFGFVFGHLIISCVMYSIVMRCVGRKERIEGEKKRFLELHGE